MKASRNKWYLFYVRVRDMWGVHKSEIMMKEFDTELDLLVWASRSRIPKGVGQHYMVTPDEVTRMPTELYGRIEQLRKDLINKEAIAEERALAAKEQKQREIREARKRKQEARAT